MRIAFLIPVMSGRGGTESAVTHLMRGLESIGDETHAYLLGGPSSDVQWLYHLPHTILGNSKQSRLRRFREYSFGLARQFRRFRPDVVVALDGPRLLKGKVALLLSPSRAQLWSWIHFPVERIAMPRVLRIANGHLAISEGVAGQLRAYLGTREAQRVVTVYNPIATDVPQPFRPAPGAPVIFLYIGRLEWEAQKRVNDLLSAAAQLKGNFRLTIIGDGTGRAQLEQYGRELALDRRTDWLGWKPDPWSAVQQASTLVLTSSFEGFAIVLAEALARGVPCISSDCKFGPNEIVQEGISGWFYPVGDVEALRNRMQHVIDQPQHLPAPATLRASAQKFSAPVVAERAHRAFAASRAVETR